MKIVIFVCAVVSLSVSAAPYFVGVSGAKITPSEEEFQNVCMGGYGSPFSRCGSTDVNDNLTVRTIVIEDFDTTMAIATIDAVGISQSLISQIKDRVNQRSWGWIKKENIYVAATHTHSGTDLQGAWGGASDEYKAWIVKRISKSILRAWRKAEPADIYVSKATANVYNRRGHDTVDDSVMILDIRDQFFGESIATLVNVSAHPTILDETNNAYSADFIHYTRKRIHNKTGSFPIVINGVVGDAAANTDNLRGFDAAKSFGIELADSIIQALDSGQKVSGDFYANQTDLFIPVSNPLILGGIQAGLLDLDLNDNGEIQTQIGAFGFGNLVGGINFPGEALTGIGLDIKEHLPVEYKFFFGLSGDSLGYFLPISEFLQIPGRTTEESVSLDPMAGELAKSTAIQLINDTF